MEGWLMHERVRREIAIRGMHVGVTGDEWGAGVNC